MKSENVHSTEKFIILMGNKYVGYGNGYPYWTPALTMAKVFNSLDLAREDLGRSDFTNKLTMNDGTIYPPTMVTSGLGLDDQNLQGDGEIKIAKILLEDVFVLPVSGKIDRRGVKPNGLTDEEWKTILRMRKAKLGDSCFD